VTLADYGLLKEDFPELKDMENEQIDEWLLNNCAFISEGQVKRL